VVQLKKINKIVVFSALQCFLLSEQDLTRPDLAYIQVHSLTLQNKHSFII